MEEKLTIRCPKVLTIAPEDGEALLRSGDGDAALLYIYILSRGGTLDLERAARELGRSDRDIRRAAETLRRTGLLAADSGRRGAVAPARELPEYPAEDLVRRSMEDPGFQQLVEETEYALGRKLSSQDLRRLFGIYDHLALPPEVILLLIQYCKDSAARSGKTKSVGIAYIEQEAYRWHDRELLTYEQAERWLERQAIRRSSIDALRREMGIYDRNLTPTERGYLERWLEDGFPPESIAMAWDRTVTKTGGINWKYMDAIIQSWKEMGLRSPEEIQRGDKPPARRSGKNGRGAPARRDETQTMEQVKRLRDKLKNS